MEVTSSAASVEVEVEVVTGTEEVEAREERDAAVGDDPSCENSYKKKLFSLATENKIKYPPERIVTFSGHHPKSPIFFFLVKKMFKMSKIQRTKETPSPFPPYFKRTAQSVLPPTSPQNTPPD